MLTKKQYKFLATFENGRVYTVGYETPDSTFDWFLHEGGLIRPRADIAEDYYVLTPDGEKALAEYRQAQEQYNRLRDDRAEDAARESMEKKVDRKVTLAAAAISSLLSATLGFLLGKFL